VQLNDVQSIKPGGPEDFGGYENLAIIFVV
jgi:hypothetical protein